jgi:tetratricopeptide (TPR) repeat protein
MKRSSAAFTGASLTQRWRRAFESSSETSPDLLDMLFERWRGIAWLICVVGIAWLICVVVIALTSGRAVAAPFVPESDSQVLERLPFAPNDPVLGRLRALNNQLTRKPDNLPLALLIAQGYIEVGRITGDPRYAGYAQAALAPWWDIEQAPPEVLVLRATVHQRMHQFDVALADLAKVLNTNPRNVQARLIRATVLQVQGLYDAAREECRALRELTEDWCGPPAWLT